MKTEPLLKEIESAFPFVKMPSQMEISFHKSNCDKCKYLRNDLEDYRNKEVTGDTIRYLHQDMSCLSAKGWLWILPYYLRFCIAPEAEYSRDEKESLIFNLSPDLKFQSETLERLSLLNQTQINCLIHFVEEYSKSEYWNTYYSDDIKRAINFLRTLS
jgi:hypothetical protein